MLKIFREVFMDTNTFNFVNVKNGGYQPLAEEL